MARPGLLDIKWTQENFPSGHASINRVVEQAVRTFRKDPRYKNDPRYIRLWMSVAKITREPLEVFKYLSLNEIGQDVALYYEEYARFLETCAK